MQEVSEAQLIPQNIFRRVKTVAAGGWRLMRQAA